MLAGNNLELGFEVEFNPGVESGSAIVLGQYDFTLQRLALGSWHNVREWLLAEIETKFGKNLPGWFRLHWLPVEGETENMIAGNLCKLRYPQEYREIFDAVIESEPRSCDMDDDFGNPIADSPEWPSTWSPLAHVPPPVFRDLLDRHRDEGIVWVCEHLLANPYLEQHMLIEMHRRLKNFEDGRVRVVAEAGANLPTSILDELVNADFEHEIDWYNRVHHRLVARPDLTAEHLARLIGKCFEKDILDHQSCTDAIRDEVERLRPSGLTLMPDLRQRATTALDRARADAATGLGLRGEPFHSEKEHLAAAVRANPGLELYEVDQIIDQYDF